jgi:single-strand DNA-binding protein
MSATRSPARRRPDQADEPTAPARNVVVLEGVLSKPVEVRSLPSGTTLAVVTVRVRADDGPARSLAVTVWDPADAVVALEAGEAVLVVGHVVRRFWGGPAGRASRTEVVADTVVPSTDRRRRRRALEQVARHVAP